MSEGREWGEQEGEEEKCLIKFVGRTDAVHAFRP
jgi:hypothetical protein